MAGKTDAYVDTSALIAFLDQSDTHHALFLQLFQKPPPLVTTPLVIAEGQGWFLKRFDTGRALQFMTFVENFRAMDIHPVGRTDILEATKLLRRFSDETLTLADAVGLALMEQRKITACWSTDRHLTLTGRPLVIHQI